MNKLQEFFYKKGNLVLCFLLIVIFFNTCGSEADRLRDMEKELTAIKEQSITPGELELLLAIERNKTAYRVVYDNNTIVRTSKRPDDVMNEYTKEIERLTKELEKYRETLKEKKEKKSPYKVTP